MNKERYYASIEEYNQLLQDRSFNTDFFPEEKQDRLFKLREVLLNRVRVMADNQLCLCHGSTHEQEETLREKISRLQTVEGKLYEEKMLEESEYHNTWVEELWFGLFTRKQMAFLIPIGTVVYIVILLLGKLKGFF